MTADAAFFSDLVRETNFYLIRHGESEANAIRVVQGHIDYPLNPRGEAQAAAAGRWLADKGITSLTSSPLSRALRTAQILAREAELPAPVPEPLFMELDTGCFSGLSLEEARKKYPKEYEDFRSGSWEAVPGAESAESLAKRAISAWSYLKGKAVFEPDHIVVFTVPRRRMHAPCSIIDTDMLTQNNEGISTV